MLIRNTTISQSLLIDALLEMKRNPEKSCVSWAIRVNKEKYLFVLHQDNKLCKLY